MNTITNKRIRIIRFMISRMLCGICLLLLMITACKEDRISPVENDDVPPKPVKNAQVENLPGQARITYDLPEDEDLLYVKAEYDINSEISREAKSSFYKKSLTVDGFADTLDYEVKLYAVDRSENESEPLSIKVKPLTPPILTAFESLQVQEDFGGVNIAFVNEAEADIVISVISKDSLGEWQSADNLYTKRSGGNFSVRGYPPEEMEFGFYVRDRWDNRSDTLVQNIVPLPEVELDKDLFDEYRLPTDAVRYSGSWGMEKMFDGIIGNQGFHTSQDSDESGFPQWNTLDLGVQAKLSRFKFWDRGAGGDSWIYTHGNVKTMELWGSNDPNPDGSWDDSWTYITTVESFKPSGLPPGDANQEDVEYAAQGQEFIIPAEAPAVRYIRFRVIESWTAPPESPNGFYHVSEIGFWGDPR